jgi:hypothetical protein
MQTEHWWSDGQTSVPARPLPGFSSGLVVVQEPDFGHRIRRSIVDTPQHRSAEQRDDEPRPDSKKPSAESAESLVPANASLEELRREWRRLYHREPPRISRDLLVRGIGYRL